MIQRYAQKTPKKGTPLGGPEGRAGHGQRHAGEARLRRPSLNSRLPTGACGLVDRLTPYEFHPYGCGSKPMGSHFGAGAPPILEPILMGIGMFTRGTGFDPWPYLSVGISEFRWGIITFGGSPTPYQKKGG